MCGGETKGHVVIGNRNMSEYDYWRSRSRWEDTGEEGVRSWN